MKNVISIIVGIAIVITLGFAESYYIDKTFKTFEKEIDSFIVKLDEGTLTENDVIESEKNWEKVKKSLHLIIPHNDIKPFNESFSELKISVRLDDYDNSLKELQVLHDLVHTIPSTYKFTIENIL